MTTECNHAVMNTKRIVTSFFNSYLTKRELKYYT